MTYFCPTLFIRSHLSVAWYTKKPSRNKDNRKQGGKEPFLAWKVLPSWVLPGRKAQGRRNRVTEIPPNTYSTGKSLMCISPMLVWMIALSETLLGPSAWVAAMTSSLEGFSLKTSLSESALFVSSGSRLVNWRTKEKKETVCILYFVFPYLTQQSVPQTSKWWFNLSDSQIDLKYKEFIDGISALCTISVSL